MYKAENELAKVQPVDVSHGIGVFEVVYIGQLSVDPSLSQCFELHVSKIGTFSSQLLLEFVEGRLVKNSKFDFRIFGVCAIKVLGFGEQSIIEILE